MSLWNTPAGRVDSPFRGQSPSFAKMLAALREADPNGEQLRALIEAERTEAERPLSAPLTAAALHTPIGAKS